MAGWGIEGDRTTCARIIFRETDIRFKTEFDSGLIDEDKSGSEGAVLKWYLNGIKTLAVMGGDKKTPKRECRLAIGGIRRSNAALTHGARDKEKHIPTRCRYVMGGELVKNYRQLDNNFSLLSFYWTTIINN
jgi:hypothetical protein